MSKTITTTTLR